LLWLKYLYFIFVRAAIFLGIVAQPQIAQNNKMPSN